MRSTVLIAGLAAVAYAEVKTVTATEDVTITSCAPTHTNCPYHSTSTAVGAVGASGVASSSGTWGDWSSTTTTSRATTVDPALPATTHSGTWSDWTTSTGAILVDPATLSSTWGDWTTTKSGATPVDPHLSTTTPSGTWGDWTAVTTPAGAVTTSTASALCPSYTAAGPPAWFSLLPSSVLSSVAAKWTGAPPADWCYYTYSTSGLVASTTPVAAATGSPYYPVAASVVAPAGTSVTGSGNAIVKPTTTGPSIGQWTGAASVNGASMAMAGLAAAAAIVMA